MRAFIEGTAQTKELRVKGENNFGFLGGTLEAQITVLLHEFAHNVSKIPSDTGDSEQSTKNTDTILDNCDDDIKAAAKKP